jgi:hypothetical protein
MSVSFYLSGGASNTDPEASLGGAQSSTTVYTPGTPSNLFGSLNSTEYSAGTVIYRCIWAVATEQIYDLKVWKATETPQSSTTVALGWGDTTGGLTIADETVAPVGVTFEEPFVAEDATSGGDFEIGDARQLWIRYTVDAVSLALDEHFGLFYAATGTVPVNTVAPVITGSSIENATLTTTTGTWSGLPTSYAYQWQESEDGSTGWANISGATSFTLTAVQVGKYVRVRVIATNDNGPGEAAFSAASDQITGVVPVLEIPPSVTGTLQEGQVLSTTDGTWLNEPTDYTYAWSYSANGSSGWTATGVTTSTLTLTEFYVGRYLRVSVTASNDDGAGLASNSNVVGPIVAIVPSNTVIPGITGSLSVGQTLTASTGTWTKSPSSYAYQWQASPDGSDWTDIFVSGSSSTFLLTSTQEGKYMRVRVTATNSGGAGTPAYSVSTAAIGSSAAWFGVGFFNSSWFGDGWITGV